MKTNVLSFELIEDSRFPDKPDINTLVSKAKLVLMELGNNYHMTTPQFLDWGESYQWRVTVYVNYGRKRQRIIEAINGRVKPVPYKVNGRNI